MATGLLGWEVGHRIDSRRRRRKTIQAIIDIITFCLTGGVSVVAYWIAAPTISPLLTAVSCVELVGLFLLGIEIIRYAEISPDR
jgi:CHASE2 domain-containing sensor protein